MKMLFIVGYRRSGTTALLSQLKLHPDIHHFHGALPDGRVRKEFHLFDLIDSAPEEYAALYRHHCGAEPSGDPTADAEAIFARSPLAVGLVKSTRLLMSAPAWQRFKTWAAATAHEVWLLGIVRFPLDTLSSDHHNFAASALPDARTLRLATAQEVWAEAYGRLLDDAGFATAVHRLRLEDVVAQPRDRLQGVTEWLDIAPFTHWIPWRPVNQGRWRTDRAMIGFAAAPPLLEVARRLGYEM